MEKNYNPKDFEEKLYEKWMKKGYFKASVNKDKTPFTIIMPPPNITSKLHMGHAFQQTIQDIIIRRKRMQGYEALWLPGTDHAAIATEAKVVEKLAQAGISKEDIGREAFLRHIEDWYKEYKGTIINQFKRMGYSCDWDRLCFTMDEQNCRAVREVFVHNDFITNLMNQKGSQEFISSFKNAAMYTKQFGNEKFTVENTYIDILNQASTAEWQSIATEYPALAEDVAYITENLDRYNNFLGLNIANSPSFTVSQAFDNGQWILLIGAILIPLLSAVTQWINVKLMPNSTQTDTKNQTEQQAAMMSSMKMMNYMMPITSAIFCFTLPAGMGIYWIAGSVVRTIQQIAINKYIDKMDIDKIVEKNKEKYEKKKEKIAEMGGYDLNTMNKYANMRTKNITSDKEVDYKNNSNLSDKSSLAAKANLVRDFNEKNSK